MGDNSDQLQIIETKRKMKRRSRQAGLMFGLLKAIRFTADQALLELFTKSASSKLSKVWILNTGNAMTEFWKDWQQTLKLG